MLACAVVSTGMRENSANDGILLAASHPCLFELIMVGGEGRGVTHLVTIYLYRGECTASGRSIQAIVCSLRSDGVVVVRRMRT